MVPTLYARPVSVRRVGRDGKPDRVAVLAESRSPHLDDLDTGPAEGKVEELLVGPRGRRRRLPLSQTAAPTAYHACLKARVVMLIPVLL